MRYSLLLFTSLVSAVSITDIQGPAFQSPYLDQVVHNVTGIVSAKDRYGFWLLGEPSSDARVSNGIRVYAPQYAGRTALGDLVTLSGLVSEYRQPARPNDLLLTELVSPSHFAIHSSGNPITPLVISRDTKYAPPLGKASALDKGSEGWLSVPNNATQLESVNATLQPDKYGLDFWESLEGRLVTVPDPTTSNFPDMFGAIWVYGDWDVNGKNERGGLTLTSIDGLPDAHPEVILIGRPLDGTRLPRVPIGSQLSNITGVVTYQFGYYQILPLTAPTVLSEPVPDIPPVSFYSSDKSCELTIGDYNVENMSPRSRHVPLVAKHIVEYLHTPDILFLQEIQSDSGSRDNGVVTANKTLSTLVQAISSAAAQLGASGAPFVYDFVNIPPQNNMDGGKPGSNIRVAYLWNPNKVSLLPGHVVGSATQNTEVVQSEKGEVNLNHNPGRIQPNHEAWEETRKPMAAAWQTTDGSRFFTVNVHLSSKRFGSSPHGDARPPVNGRVERRTQQVNITADFVKNILQKDVNASVIVAGDMNDFTQTRSVFRSFTDVLTDINDASGVDPVERYTYVYEQHMQEIDHMFVSDAIVRRGTQVEHIHVNTWARSTSSSDRASDHDPTVAKVWVCDKPSEVGSKSPPYLVVQEANYMH
ncbi:hypothetical protein QCA50_005928 [Cerrena zonata]|uniref:Endonuclease/exonuclease/phosphatase domain-containing protein n=1 Tax=Cerrena zonata TaxID=2478898 RepID=A0AAW0GGJ1_9APHY